jgi:zinc protease
MGRRAASGPASGDAGARPASAALQRARLDNGLELVVLPNPVVPLTTIEIDVRNGAYTETEAYDGLSHLYEHMFFKANERLPDQESYLRRTRELGMEWNGTTSEERVNYYFTLQSRELDAGLRFMADAIRTPLFLQEELERERVVVLGEYDRAEADPGFHLHVAVAKALWHRHYTRKNVIGTREVILGATRDKMFDIQRRFYVPNNSALLLAGDIDLESALPRVQAAFGDWSPGPDPFAQDPIPHHPPLPASTWRIVEQPVHSVSALVAWHGPSVELQRAETHAADVLSFIVGQRNSRFYRRLVDSGLAAGASLHYQTLRFTGPIQAHLVTTVERFAEAYAALLHEVEALAEPGAFSDEELETARAQLEIEQVYEAERPSRHVHTLGYWWAVAGLEYWLDYGRDLRRVERDDVQRFVQRWITGRPRVTGVLTAPEHRAAVESVLEAHGR